MNLSLEDVLSYLRQDTDDKQIVGARIKPRENQVVAAQYFFETRASGPQPITSAIRDLQKYHYSEWDKFIPVPYDDVDEAIAGCKAICEHFSSTLSSDDETYLRQSIPNEGLCYLIIIERPIFFG